MADIDGERLCFIAEWFDEPAEMTRRFYLNYFINTKSTQMINIKTRKLFLKKSKVDTITEDQLYIGNMIHVFGRPLTIVDFGDEYTRKKLSSKKEKTLAIIKPDTVNKMGEIMKFVVDKGLVISNLRMCRLEQKDCQTLYSQYLNEEFYTPMVKFMSSGPVMSLELLGENAVSRWREFMGPADPAEARRDPLTTTSLRARFGTDRIHNAVHGSDSPESAARELEFFFPKSGPRYSNTAMFTDCTCCVIKPHAVSAGKVGTIMETIQAHGFEISMAMMFYLEKANIEEFLEVYRGVVHEYPAMVEEMRYGPCVVMEVRGENVPKIFREFTGPVDPEIARHLRPNTLRAMFGKDKIQNAIHCTDLPEDAVLEVEYFFKILDN